MIGAEPVCAPCDVSVLSFTHLSSRAASSAPSTPPSSSRIHLLTRPLSSTLSSPSTPPSSSRIHQLTRPLSSTLYRVELSPASMDGYLQGQPPDLVTSEAEIDEEGRSAISPALSVVTEPLREKLALHRANTIP